MNKYYAIAMLAALKVNRSNMDELDKVRRLSQKHNVSINMSELQAAGEELQNANDELFAAIRTQLNDCASTNPELEALLIERSRI